MRVVSVVHECDGNVKAAAGQAGRPIIPECTQVVNYRLKVVGAARLEFELYT